MQVAAFGQATRAGGVGLLAIALATLAIGLYTYSTFLLFARAYYALGDARTPAFVAVVSALAGIGVMVAGGVLTSGRTTVAFLGLGHTVAYAVGAVVLWLGLARRLGHRVVPASLGRAVVVTAPLAAAAWALVRVIDPAGRLATALLVAGIVVVAGAVYVVALRAIGGVPTLHPAPPSAPTAGDVEPYGAPA
jgi:putative peptidoglycan lipid II flippase